MKTKIHNLVRLYFGKFINSKLNCMSKTVQLTLLLCIAALIGKSQPWSEKLYAHPSSFCSSGCTVNNNTPFGFLMGGFNPLAATNSPNFYIDRTKTGGQFGGGLFSNDYFVYGDNACASNAPQASGFYGVSVIETPNTGANTPNFVVAGAFDEGCFYSSLSSTGATITTKFFPFPVGAMSITKPLIVESLNTAYDYFICGSYSIGGVQKMYVIKLNLAGTVLQSKLYTTTNPNGGDLFPNGLIYSPYGTELVIVGKAANLGSGGGVEDRAFFIKLNDNSLAINFSNLYGKVASALNTDYFTTIAAAPSATPGSAGYAIGGYTDFSTTNGLVWTLKVNAAGTIINNCNWISLPFSDGGAKDVVGLVERYSNTYGTTY
ncbi:MAG TPA: hypothetical protein PL029_09195, partial [Bacteroidia bacterium]|nr:hypothetical protein [Bacteroidia bacterium]